MCLFNIVFYNFDSFILESQRHVTDAIMFRFYIHAVRQDENSAEEKPHIAEKERHDDQE